MVSAYRITRPSMLRAARPMVWISDGLRAQEAFLVGIQDRHQRAFGNVQPLAQQVDAHQHVEHAQTQVADDLDALQRVDVGVQVAHLHAVLGEIVGQVLGHALGQRGDQHARRRAATARHSASRSSTWRSTGPDFGHRVDQAGRTDHLLGEHAAGAFHLPRAGRGGDEDRLRPEAFPLLELQRPVVDAGGQAEAEFGQHRLAGEVAAIHAAELRHGDVALIDDQQRVLRQVFEQGRRRLARVRGRSDSASSSRCLCRSRSSPSSRCRRWCAAAAARPPAVCLRVVSSSSRCFSSILMSRIAWVSVGRGVT